MVSVVINSATFNPHFFDVADLEDAKRLVVTSERGISSEERWEKEAPYLVRLLSAQLGDLSGRVVLDYGCGIGRVAKELIHQAGCQVVGVDQSAKMRELALAHVASPDFCVISRRMLQAMAKHGFRADAAICVWVLQHAPKPAEDIVLMANAMKPGAPLFVANNHQRVVPALETVYVDDGVDIAKLLSRHFDLKVSGALDPKVVGETVSEGTFWASYVVR